MPDRATGGVGEANETFPTRAWISGIRVRLAVALAVALLPILALSAIQSRAAYLAEVEDRRDALLGGAERSAAAARAQLDGAVVLLETLRPEAIGLFCVPRLRQLTERLDGYSALARLSRTGRVVCASEQTPPSASVQASPWFQALRNGEAMVISQVQPGVFGQAGGVLAAVRAERPLGAFDGAFVAIIPIERLRPDPGDRDLPAGVEAALLSRTGQVLTATRADRFPQRIAVSRLEGAEDGTLFVGEDRHGGSRLFALAAFGPQDVYLLVSAPRQNVLAWAWANALGVFVLPLLTWLLALSSVLLVSERVVLRWLAYLERVAAIYARGRFSVRPMQAVHAPLEIRNLGRALDDMREAIEARDAAVRDSLEEKDALLREVHHRVKNNLQVITSLLNMQQRAMADPVARTAMSDTRQRITALALIYRALYQGEDVRRVDVGRFLNDLVGQLISGSGLRGGAVETHVEADSLVIDPDKLAPLALFAVEAVSNAEKHAFRDRGGRLVVTFRVRGAESVLEVIDDGPGAEPDTMRTGVGGTLMTAFARQLRGRLEMVTGPQGGVCARLTFPTPEAMGRQTARNRPAA